MRPLEIATLALLALSLSGMSFSRKRPLWMIFLPFVIGIIVVLHVLLESYRWQMIPAYILAISLIVISVFDLVGYSLFKRKKTPRIFFGITGAIFLIASFIFSLMLPVFSLPLPDGEYAIGTTSFHLVDRNRIETMSSDSTEYREIGIRIWYPVDEKPVRKAMPWKLKTSLKKWERSIYLRWRD